MPHAEPRRFPLGALLGAAAVVCFAIAAAATARLADIGVTRVAETEPVAVRALRFEDRSDGGVAVIAADSDRTIDVLAPGQDSFVRIVLRSLARERLRQDHGREIPFHIVRYADGRLSVEDPSTGRRVDLGAFGAVNAASFARLMTVEETTQ
ncbi:photosynthetic complex assembly protein PuhC [Pseudorhodoplanes sp.]|uniref:photosynthetic complex assembly protein PuhC n=1 Tax=Pseudorhodoplanes sp. TaxID=1934341 RepID=UPI00391916E7